MTVLTYDPDQERDDVGRWSPSGEKAAAALDQHMPAATAPAIPSDPPTVTSTPSGSLASPQFAHLPLDDIYREGHRGRYALDDKALAAVWRAQGFDGKPTVVSADEFDAARGDSPVLYRGLSGPSAQTDRQAEQFRTGEPFVGRGMYGDGVYTTTSFDDVDRYTKPYGWRGGTDTPAGEGTVMRMALAEDARVVDYDDMTTKFREWDDQWAQRLDSAPDDQRSLLEGQRSKELFITEDVGRHAAALGYQAVRVPAAHTETADHFIIQDRTAVIVEEAQP